MSLTCINEKGELAIDGTFAVPYKLEKGETCDTFSSKILHTEYQFSLDLTPHGDVAILHTSHGGDFKVRILPVQGDFLVKPVNLRQGLFGYKGGKADLEADLAKFERGKCVDSIDGMELATLNRGLRMYAIRHGAYMDNSGRSIDEDYAILKASPDFAYGKRLQSGSALLWRGLCPQGNEYGVDRKGNQVCPAPLCTGCGAGQYQQGTAICRAGS